MNVGDLVKIWLNEDESEVGIIVDMDKNLLPEKVFVKTVLALDNSYNETGSSI